MKNILIPTTLQPDTVFAVKAAIIQSAGTQCIITLLLLNDTPDVESAAYFLRKTTQITTPGQTIVFEECKKELTTHLNCAIEVHNQYGLTAPLLKNLLDHLGTSLIIIPSSYKEERNAIHHYCLSLLSNSKIPMLHLNDGCEEAGFNKALYLENKKTQLDIQQLQQLVNAQFTFKIVSHASINEQYPDELKTQLTEAISKNEIDLLIETRKAEKIRKKTKGATVNNSLGLPVLSIYEEAVL